MTIAYPEFHVALSLTQQTYIGSLVSAPSSRSSGTRIPRRHTRTRRCHFDRMASTAQTQQQGYAEAAVSASPKRALDDDVEFVSSKPVKKRRPTYHAAENQNQNLNQNLNQNQNSGQQQPQVMPPPPPVPIIYQKAIPNQATGLQVDRSRSMVVGVANTTTPVPDMSLDDRGASLPLFENFKFPPPHSPSGPSRLHLPEQVSPKSMPRTVSPAMLRASALPSNAPHGTPPRPTVRLDQISCLDFNGYTTPSSSASIGQDLSKNMRTQIDNLPSQIAGPTGLTGNRPPAPPVLGALNSQSGIPFTMYSTGNLVPMPLTQHPYTPYPLAPDTGPLSKPIAGTAAAAYASSFATGSSGATQRQDHLHMASSTGSSGSIMPSNIPITPGTSSHSTTARRANCLICAMGRPGANTPQLAYQSQGFQFPSDTSSHHHHRQDHPPKGFQMGSVGALTMHPTVGANKSSEMLPPPTNPSSAAPQGHQLNSRLTPAPDPPRNKKHAQNLLVDVAETVEAVFPYTDVATRHGVAPSKVAEALSGVVLLPLLRCASDKRRAGPLAQERMKEYRDVRQDWQAGAPMTKGASLGVGELSQLVASRDRAQTGG